MCGIAGIISPHAHCFRPHAEKMLAALRHRGPDASAILSFPNTLLAHARLSIVDLDGGAQPMPSALDPKIAVTFNGEIYGYQPLRDSLPNYPFRTASDTELLPALYHRHGPTFTQHLPGMFAFALWDDNTQTLLAARDRFGEKPLYYAPFTYDGTPGLLFASELKSLLAANLLTPRLNRDALAHYLQHLYVHPRQTIYDNIHTLPPAHTLTYQNNQIAIDRYWQLPPTNETISLDSAKEQFRHLFTQAIAKQLIADVPVARSSSGGLDSSTVVAIAAKLKPGLQTYAFRFSEGGVDETPYAQAVADMHHTNHHILTDRDTNLATLLEDMSATYDEPFADSSNIPTYLISKLARQHLKVVLTGDAGDELLAGYPWYRSPELKPPHYFSNATLEKFYLAPSRMQKQIDGMNPLDASLRTDLLDYMPGDILTKIDRASMAHGLELRAPFLDLDLASFLISLPPRFKLNDASDKLLLRQTFSDLWPSSIQNRPKQGFGAPVPVWLTRPSVQHLVTTRLRDPDHPLFQLLPFDATRIAVNRQNFQTWTLLTLALWLECHPL